MKNEKNEKVNYYVTKDELKKADITKLLDLLYDLEKKEKPSNACLNIQFYDREFVLEAPIEIYREKNEFLKKIYRKFNP